MRATSCVIKGRLKNKKSGTRPDFLSDDDVRLDVQPDVRLSVDVLVIWLLSYWQQQWGNPYTAPPGQWHLAHLTHAQVQSFACAAIAPY